MKKEHALDDLDFFLQSSKSKQVKVNKKSGKKVKHLDQLPGYFMRINCIRDLQEFLPSPWMHSVWCSIPNLKHCKYEIDISLTKNSII